MNPKVDEYLSKASRWQEEMEKLRTIILDCGLTEELKWGVPCYTFQKNNIVLIGAFKDYFTLSFFKGVLLKDSDTILSKPGENTHAARLVKFKNLQEVEHMTPILKTYIKEAIEIEKAGLKVDYKERNEFEIPEELQSKMKGDPALEAAFFALTPGRQRAYVLYFNAPKQSKTRITRIEKYTQRILDGKGINDCVCGLSKKMPGCDGSHKYLK